ncbi:MAG: alpha/beta fold hydrolase [Legionella sp.]|nr:alpha/beta fold hydrolase [Legionella sp.]
MNADDFRFIHQKKHILNLKKEDGQLLEPICKQGIQNERALLLLHGFSSSPAVFRLLIPHIKGYDSIHCPVLPGHAQSLEAFSQSTAPDWLANVNLICNELISKYNKVDILGLSLGGLLALKLSQDYPINHLYLLAPALKLHVRLNVMLALALTLKYLGFKDLRNLAGNLVTTDQAEIAYRKLPINVSIEILNFIKTHQWVHPTCPVDLFLGEKDMVVASDQVESLFTPSKTVTIHRLVNSAHVLPLDNDYNQIIDCINAH